MDAKAPVVSFSQMLAAGLASAGAAVATSRFGVAGTLVGAALTTMIITGGSAVLKSYLDAFGGRIRTGMSRQNKAKVRGDEPVANEPVIADDAPTQAVETRAGRREGFFGKIRSAFAWFKNLPASTKTSILLKAAIPMVVVFVIAVVAVTGAELVGGRTLSCMVWGECYAAADGTGARSSLGSLASGGGGQSIEQPGLVPGGDSSDGSSGGGLFDRGGGAADEQYSQ